MADYPAARQSLMLQAFAALFALFMTVVAHAGFVEMTRQYPEEGIVIACIFALIAGTIVAVKYQPPNGAASSLTPAGKGGLAFIGGIAAFIYMITLNKELYLMQALGVLAVAVTSPALYNIVYTLVVDKLVKVITVLFFDTPKKDED